MLEPLPERERSMLLWEFTSARSRNNFGTSTSIRKSRHTSSHRRLQARLSFIQGPTLPPSTPSRAPCRRAARSWPARRPGAGGTATGRACSPKAQCQQRGGHRGTRRRRRSSHFSCLVLSALLCVSNGPLSGWLLLVYSSSRSLCALTLNNDAELLPLAAQPRPPSSPSVFSVSSPQCSRLCSSNGIFIRFTAFSAACSRLQASRERAGTAIEGVVGFRRQKPNRRAQ